ncbi:MAG: SusE domain-containing protein, partial [Muribaculaceae bacterium]|nr:SusE domain-containing protein [Muribaculaceae bacterium]
MALLAGAVTACGDEEIDNSYSRNNSVIQLSTSTSYVVLDESKPDDVALTVEWNEAHPYGSEYITTYQYQMDAVGSKASAVKEYEDDGMYCRTYTNRELQNLLIEHFGCLTSTLTELNLTVTASFEGPRVVIPDIATATVRVKTYGAKQYLADRLFMGGTAVGDNRVELTPTSATSGIYNWNGALNAGKINFPVIYGDEDNAISPATADAPIDGAEMPAVMVDAADANYWVIPADGNYRITINMNAHTVKIVDAGSIIEMDRLLLAGSAVGAEEIEVTRAPVSYTYLRAHGRL